MPSISRNGNPHIGADDLKAVTRLLGEIAALTDPPGRKRRMLIDGLAALTDTDGWIWTAGCVDADRHSPMSMGTFAGGLTDEQVAAQLDAASDTSPPFPCNDALAALVAGGEPFVRTRQQLVDDDGWYDNANVKRYSLRHGIDHTMYAICPLGQAGFSGIAFFRFLERPAFSERHRQIAELVVTEVRWLCNTSLPVAHGPVVEKLTPRLRSVLTLLLDGYHCDEIADLLVLSAHTVKGYIRDIYQHFGVRSQVTLIRHFREGVPGRAEDPLK